MPTVTINQPDFTVDEAVTRLKSRLGSGYTVEPRDRPDHLKVAKGAMTYANVHLSRDATATQVHVHGGGFMIGRLINEFTIARAVAGALRDGA